MKPHFSKQGKLPKRFKLSISPYKLSFKNKLLSPLEGSLLAFDFGSGLTGYSDFLPWPRFGEPSLFRQLHYIQKGEFSQRFLIAKHNAFLDAQARSEKRSLFYGLKIPPSHFLIEDLLNFKTTNLISEKNFKKVKVKLAPYQINEQIKKLKNLNRDLSGVQWRLDCNGLSWRLWKDQLKFLKEDIDFIEDPLPGELWDRSDQKLWAQDWIPSLHSQIKIVKPSRDCLNLLIKELGLPRWKRIVFTHSFDHLLGQAVTAYWAGLFYKRHPQFFETGSFTCSPLSPIDSYPLYSKLSPDFIPPAGFGFGFSDSLKKEPWKQWI